MANWVYEALGANRLHTHGRAFTPERKTAALLVYLALEGPTPRSKLAGLLWPDSEEGTARNNLSQTLRRLKTLSGEALVLPGEALTLAPTLSVDAARVKEASLSGRPGEVAAAPGELLAPLEYDDLPELSEWLWSTRAAFEDLYKEALLTLVSSRERAGDLAGALKAAERLVAADPVSETGHRLVMRLYYLQGDRPAALRAYKRLKETLARELGVEPLPETVALARTIAQGGGPKPTPKAPSKTLPLSVLRPPVLVGREEAWAALEGAWARGQTIYVTGEPGVGKTRLVQEFAASKGRTLYLPARPGHQDVLFAAAASLARTRLAEAQDVTLPAWVRRELSRILPEFRAENPPRDPPPPLGGEEDKLRFFQAYVEMVRLTGAGFVATISDDTQYYDPATVELGGFMIAQRAGQPVGAAIPRLIIVYRRGELSPTTERYLDQFIASELAVRIELGPLDAQSTTSLLTSLNLQTLDDGVSPRLSEAVHRHTGGNALFILETLRDLLESGGLQGGLPERLPLSRRVGATLQGRLKRLSPAAQRLAQAAATLQHDFDLETLARMLGQGPFELIGAWDELARAQVLSGERFSHDLLFEAVRAAIPPGVGALLHRRAAEVLAERGATPARVANHYLSSGDEERAAPYLVRAAERAKDTLRLVEAAERFERAGAIYARAGGRERAFEALRAGLRVRLEFDLGEGAARTLHELKACTTTPLTRAIAWRLEAEWHMRRGDLPGTEAAARAGLAALGEGRDARARIELLNFLGVALARQGRLEESAVHVQELLALTDTLTDTLTNPASPPASPDTCPSGTWLSAQLGHAASVLDDLSRSREALPYHRRALGLPGSPRERPVALADYAFSLLTLGQAQEALAPLQEARTLLHGVKDAPIIGTLVLNRLAEAQRFLGRYDEALGTLGEALRVSGNHAAQRSSVLLRRAKLYLTLGALEAADADLSAVQTLAQDASSAQGVRLGAALARLYRAQGRDPAAVAVLEEAEAQLGDHTAPRLRLLLRLEGALYSERFAAEALRLAKDHDLTGFLVGAHTRYAAALLTQGRVDRARDHAERAAEGLAAHTPVDFYPGEVLLTHVQVMRAAADPGVRAASEAALAWLGRTAERVPEAYRDGFWTCNPVNRALLGVAAPYGLRLPEAIQPSSRI